MLIGIAIGFALNWLALLLFTGRFVDSSSASCGSGDTSIPIPQVTFPEPHWRTPDTLGVRVVARDSAFRHGGLARGMLVRRASLAARMCMGGVVRPASHGALEQWRSRR